MKRCLFLAFASVALWALSLVVGSPTVTASDLLLDDEDRVLVGDGRDDGTQAVGQDQKGKKGMKGKGKGKGKGMKGKGKGKGKKGMKKKTVEAEDVVVSVSASQSAFAARLEGNDYRSMAATRAAGLVALVVGRGQLASRYYPQRA